jgi:glutathione-regulated potassium-efflux system protein KefB
MSAPNLLLETTVYLGAAVVAVTVCKRFNLGAVLGYLIAGIAIGPNVLGLIGDAERVLHFAEFGVVMLLFLIGLELDPQRLWSMRRPIFGLGGLQVLLTIGAVMGVAVWQGVGWQLALVAGMGLAMSSTALGLASLSERNLLQTPGGQGSFSILLFQDIAVIPMMTLLVLLASGAGSALDPETALPGVGVIVAIVVVGRYLVRPILRVIAATGLREIFLAFSLLLVVGASLAVASVGLSMALGSFLAGLLLADSEYRHELELDIEPFKGLLLGLFFIAIGMSVDIGYIIAEPAQVLGITAAVLLGKFVLLVALARVFGLSTQHALLVGVALSQVGEFAFVLYGVAQSLKLLTTAQANLLNAVVATSMMVTPLAFVIHGKLTGRRMNRPRKKADKIEQVHQVLIAGYGRFGQMVARLLEARGIHSTVVDNDAGQVELMRRFGQKAYFGDITRAEMLERAGLKDATLLVLAIDDPQATVETVRRVRKQYPDLHIIARARGRTDAFELIDEGVEVIRETFEAAIKTGVAALVALGTPAHAAWRFGRQFKAHDEVLLRRAIEIRHDESALIGLAQAGREDLEELLRTEQGPHVGDPLDEAWSIEDFPRPTDTPADDSQPA